MQTLSDKFDVRRSAGVLPQALREGSRLLTTRSTLRKILRTTAARTALRLFERLLPRSTRPLKLVIPASGYSDAQIARSMMLLSDESLVANLSDPECVSEIVAHKLACEGLIASSEPGSRIYTEKGCTMLSVREALFEDWLVERSRTGGDPDEHEFCKMLRELLPSCELAGQMPGACGRRLVFESGRERQPFRR